MPPGPANSKHSSEVHHLRFSNRHPPAYQTRKPLTTRAWGSYRAAWLYSGPLPAYPPSRRNQTRNSATRWPDSRPAAVSLGTERPNPAPAKPRFARLPGRNGAVARLANPRVGSRGVGVRIGQMGVAELAIESGRTASQQHQPQMIPVSAFLHVALRSRISCAELMTAGRTAGRRDSDVLRGTFERTGNGSVISWKPQKTNGDRTGR